MPKSRRSKRSGRVHGRKKKEAPGPFTAAGLIRFYEEADVGIKMKPHTLVILSLVFAILIIILEKLF